MDYWYVLFITTGKEQEVETILKILLDREMFSPFVPMLETAYRGGGKRGIETKPMFPGYIFIETDLKSQEFRDKIWRTMYYLKDVYKVLRYGNSYDCMMRDDEKSTLLSLCGEDYYMEMSSGIIIGDKVYIKAGPLQGWESVIKKVDRHNRRAIIEIPIFGEMREVQVGLEIVEKI